MPEENVPSSPESFPADVREELEQDEMTHQGNAREEGDNRMSDHMGAREDEPTPVTPPMTGPSRITEGSTEDDGVDPYEELTGG